METIQRFIIAGALGLVTLEIFSLFFGQFFELNLGAPFAGGHGAQVQPAYLPLYAGQTTRLIALRTEGIQGGAGVQGVQTI